MTGFLPETHGVIDVEEIDEIRRLHFVEKATFSELAKQFKLSEDYLHSFHPGFIGK